MERGASNNNNYLEVKKAIYMEKVKVRQYVI